MNKTELVERIKKDHDILASYDGHIERMGKCAGKEKNPYWRVVNNKTQEEYYIIYCEKDSLTKVSLEDIDLVFSTSNFTKHPTWFTQKAGYIASESSALTKGQLTMHALIMGHYGNGKGQDSVDHINRDKLDNRRSNLRIATQSEQNANMDRKTRRRDASELPEELKNLPMYKYIYITRRISDNRFELKYEKKINGHKKTRKMVIDRTNPHDTLNNFLEKLRVDFGYIPEIIERNDSLNNNSSSSSSNNAI